MQTTIREDSSTPTLWEWTCISFHNVSSRIIVISVIKQFIVISYLQRQFPMLPYQILHRILLIYTFKNCIEYRSLLRIHFWDQRCILCQSGLTLIYSLTINCSFSICSAASLSFFMSSLSLTSRRFSNLSKSDCTLSSCSISIAGSTLRTFLS